MSAEARDAIFERLRRALGRHGPGVSEARRAIEARLANPQPTLIPARADLPLAERVALFIAQAEAVQSTVLRTPRYATLPDVVADYLRSCNLPLRLVMAADPVLRRADWRRGMVEARVDRVSGEDPIGLTTAFAGIAETGTLMLLSAPETPTLLAFLPETAIVLLPTTRILRAYEDGFRLLRQEKRGLPRSINLITGPSRSGDIEQTIQLGAHGPRRLCIVLVDEPASGDTDS